MIKKIVIDELKPGMYLSGLEKEGAAGVIFFVNNILVDGGGDIRRFIKSGYMSAYVEIEEELDLDEPRPETAKAEAAAGVKIIADAQTRTEPHAPSGDEGPAAVDRVDFHEALEEAKEIRRKAQDLVRGFMANVRMGKEIEAGPINESVDSMVGSVFKNQDALASLARLKSFDDYTFAHSVNVCILAIAIGRQMGLDENSLHDLGVGAILHDVGKMLIPEVILKKPGPLTDDEYAKIKKHPALGSEILLKTRGISDSSRYVSFHHHERFDGAGYGERISGEEIHAFARIAAVADTYDAMTSNRVYQKALLPEDALKKMYALRGKQFEPSLVERLVKCLGIYPIGTLVELNTGEMSVVRSLNRDHPLQPNVLMVFDKSGSRFPRPFEVDLKDEIGRWVVTSKDPGELAPEIENLIA